MISVGKILYKRKWTWSMLKGFGAQRTEELVSPRIVCAYVKVTTDYKNSLLILPQRVTTRESMVREIRWAPKKSVVQSVILYRLNWVSHSHINICPENSTPPQKRNLPDVRTGLFVQGISVATVPFPVNRNTDSSIKRRLVQPFLYQSTST